MIVAAVMHATYNALVEKIRVERSDGRYLFLYALERPAPALLDARALERGSEQLELRWNPLLDEWVIVSTGRQWRTFLPPDASCPLCPTRDPAAPTELPVADFELAAFENRFPSLRAASGAAEPGARLARRAPAAGACEVVVYSPDHDGALTSMSQAQVRGLVDVWADRYADLAARDDVAYVFVFENRGKEIGVTLTHPHGQIYAFSYVPPHVEAEQRAARRHFEETGECLQCDVVAQELASGARIVAESHGFVAYVPFAARVPYEVHVAAAAHRESLLDLRPVERDGLAAILRDVQAMYDALWDFAMPYTMCMHQRPADGVERPGDHLHIEFMPPYRTKDRLKYLAGVETGAGTFINDTAPEEKAAELRAARGKATGDR